MGEKKGKIHMKKAKSIICVVLAFMLVFATAITSFAAGEGSITISNAVDKQSYAVYKMFKLVASESGSSYVYTAEDEWANFIGTDGKGADYFEKADGTIKWKGEDTAARKSEVAKLALAYAKDNNIQATVTKTADGDEVKFENLELGYYLVDSSLGALCGLTTTNTAAKVEEKNDQPKVDKTVKEDSTGTYGESNTASIGDTVEFKTVITAQAGAENYVLHDKMEKGLTFNTESVVVKSNDVTLNAGTDYTLTVSADSITDGCTFEIDFSDAFEATLTKDQEITVTYTAVLNKDAEIYTETNDNQTWLNYGDNNSTAVDTTKTSTFEFDLVKTDEENTIINGAEFKLYSDEDCTQEVSVIYDDAIKAYRPTISGETGAVITAGNIKISGLDSDAQTTYYLKETQAPSGYNILPNAIKVELRDNAGNATNLKATIDDTKWTEGGIHVINQSGSLLPETGGIGTIIFYVIGGLLVVGAVVLLITKKKASSEA